MAQLYTIKCPKCGTVFSVPKGVLMSWDFSKPIPIELRDEINVLIHGSMMKSLPYSMIYGSSR